MKSTCSSLFTIACAFLLLIQPAWAAVIKLDGSHFPDAQWSVMPYGSAVVHQPYVETRSLQNETWLAIARTSSTSGQNANSAQIIYNGGKTNTDTGAPVSDEANQLGDVRGSMILGASNWSSDVIGFVLRAQGAPFNNNVASRNAYILSVNILSGQPSLSLYYNVGNEYTSALQVITLATESTTEASLLALNTTSNNQYFLEFSFIGNHLTASLSLWDVVNDIKGNTFLSLNYTDTRPEARLTGYYGVRGGRFGSIRTAYFRDIEFQTIPEPSSVALLLFSAGALWLVGRRRKAC